MRRESGRDPVTQEDADMRTDIEDERRTGDAAPVRAPAVDVVDDPVREALGDSETARGALDGEPMSSLVTRPAPLAVLVSECQVLCEVFS